MVLVLVQGHHMLDELHARNIALIREASIEPAAGLTVITGETGSGKTAFLSALKLLVGERAESDLVREGANELTVDARVFYAQKGTRDAVSGSLQGTAPESVHDAANESVHDATNESVHDAANESVHDVAQEHIIKRSVSKDGRSRVWIDGDIESVKALATTIGATIDLCGQHEHQKLLEPSNHVKLLDAWASKTIDAPLHTYRQALHAKREAEATYQQIAEMAQTGAEKLAQATYVKDRIEALLPTPAELADIENNLATAEHAEQLAEHTQQAAVLIGDDDGALQNMQAAHEQLLEAAHYDEKLLSLAQQLQSSLAEAEDVTATLRAYISKLDIDPARLAYLQQKQADLQSLLRMFGPGMHEVEENLENARTTIQTLVNVDESLQHAQDALDQARVNLQQTAQALTDARKQAAPRFVQAVTNEMAKLQMGTAVLEMQFTPLPENAWTESGPARVEFMYRPAENLSSKPLKKIASGGEMSRIMLAIKVVAGTADEVETLVFDEVDAGVGGQVAVSLARVLKELSKTHQILCVTHLAQIASVADKHYVVQKYESADSNAGSSAGSAASNTSSNVPQTILRHVSGKERIEEIARMLSGDVTEISLSHAKTLLSSS